MERKVVLLIALSSFILAASSCGGKGAGGGAVIPVIHSIATAYDGNKAVAGQPVTIIGENFSATASENKVLYGVGLDAIALKVSEAASERLVFTAPSVSTSSIFIRVSTLGKESNSLEMQYTKEPEPDDWSDEPTLDFTALGGIRVTVVPGVEWTTFHGTWEGQVRNINIVRTTLNEHNRLGIYYNYATSYPDGYSPVLAEGEDPRDLDKKCIYKDAVAGTNGPMACCQFVRVNGVVGHAATDADNWIENCAITIDDDGTVNIVKVLDNYYAARLSNKTDDHPENTLTVGCAGPLLVWEGKVQTYPDWATQDFLRTTHPRTAIGLSKDGKTVVQVTVDGRWDRSTSAERAIGMSTDLLGKLMLGLGCYKAMNFDGGGGTAMWVYGQGNARNIVNRVCENRWNWNGTVLRPTANAVYIKSDLKNAE